MAVNKKFGFSHKSGLLMAVSSLPSEYGIGSFGKPCYDWIDFMDKTSTKCWQVLPLNPTISRRHLLREIRILWIWKNCIKKDC